MKRTTKHPFFKGSQKLALAIGTVAVVGALYVLLESSVRTGHWSATDVVMPLALIITIGCGKLLYSAWSDRVYSSAAGFAIAFLVGTTVVVLASVGKQATTYDATTSAITKANEGVAALKAEISDAHKKIARLEIDISNEVKGLAKRTKRGKFIRWIVSPGCGPTCKGQQNLLAQQHLELTRLKRDLSQAGPTRKADAKASHVAELLILLGLAAEENRPNIVKGVALISPILVTLLFELTGCWGFGFAFHKPRVKPVREETAPGPTGGRKTRKDKAQADVIQFRKPIPQSDLAERWNVTKGMVSQWLEEFEGQGLVTRSREGGRSLVHPAPRLVANA